MYPFLTNLDMTYMQNSYAAALASKHVPCLRRVQTL